MFIGYFPLLISVDFANCSTLITSLYWSRWYAGDQLLVASELIVFAIFFLDVFTYPDERHDISGRSALGAIEFLGVAASLYLLTKGRSDNASLIDWLSCALALLAACLGFTGSAITFFALYLLVRDRGDLNTKAAGTVAAAVAVQAVWAPLVFSKISFLLLQGDASVVGWLLGFVVPGASWEAPSSIHQADITSSLRSRALLFIIFLWRRCVG